jgi:hypothetical protein
LSQDKGDEVVLQKIRGLTSSLRTTPTQSVDLVAETFSLTLIEVNLQVDPFAVKAIRAWRRGPCRPRSSAKVIVATIKRGAMRKYDGAKANEERGTLFDWYDEDNEVGSTNFNSPLILAVDKGKYKEVVLMENGQKAGTARLGKSRKKR